MTITKPFFLILLSYSIVSLSGGCATLPNVSKMIEETPTTQEPPQIASSKGLLSPEKSRAIMERLKRSVDPTDILQRHNVVLESVSGSPLTKGNKVTLLVDGQATYAAMFKAIENARNHINLETFIIEDDETGRRFADLLLKKQAEGVQVNLIYDVYGSFSTPASFFQPFPCSGIQVLKVHHLNPVEVQQEMATGTSGAPQDCDRRRKGRYYRGHQHQSGLFEHASPKETKRKDANALA